MRRSLGYDERDCSWKQRRSRWRSTKGYHDQTCIEGLRSLGVVPLVGEYTSSKNWKNWLNDKEREHPQFALSQKKRRLIEKVFSWIKMVAGPAKDQVARASPSRVGFPPRCRSLQLGPHDQADSCDVVPRQQCP